MPNGGFRPDCVHCKANTGQPLHDGVPFCGHHQTRLPIPAYVFCRHFINAVPEEPEDWLDRLLERGTLQEGLMYLWLGNDDLGWSYVPLVPVHEYGQWTGETFYAELERLAAEWRASRSPDSDDPWA